MLGAGGICAPPTARPAPTVSLLLCSVLLCRPASLPFCFTTTPPPCSSSTVLLSSGTPPAAASLPTVFGAVSCSCSCSCSYSYSCSPPLPPKGTPRGVPLHTRPAPEPVPRAQRPDAPHATSVSDTRARGRVPAAGSFSAGNTPAQSRFVSAGPWMHSTREVERRDHLSLTHHHRTVITARLSSAAQQTALAPPAALKPSPPAPPFLPVRRHSGRWLTRPSITQTQTPTPTTSTSAA